MQSKKNKDIKYKRVLFYFRELERYKISMAASLQFMVYVFNITEERLLRIQREADEKDYQEVKLDFMSSDISAIDAFVRNTMKVARNQRSQKK